MARGLNWTDSLDKQLAYVVLKKNNRVQVLVHPTRDQLRRRGRRNWSLVAAVPPAEGGNGRPVPPDEVRDAVVQTLAELAAGDQAKQDKDEGKKAKKKKARA